MTQRLRPISHPGQSETLVHFTGRARPSFAPEVYFMTPEERLNNIAWEQRLRGHAAGPGQRVVCLSESDPDGIAAMLSRAGFAGWGVVLSRQWVWDQGGGPVWYVRDDAWERVRGTLAQDLHAWIVRTEPGASDWLHEREWRVPCPDGSLLLDPVGVIAFLVSDPRWEPPTVSDHMMDPTSGQLVVGEVTVPWAVGVPVWHWDGEQVWDLGPTGPREEPWAVQP